MWVTRQVLKQGNKLILANNEYKIIEEIGKGTSSIVYLAEDCSNSRLVLIKELYPKNLGIFRNTDNSLVIPASSNDNFEIYKSYLREAVKLQIEFHNSDELANSTSDAERIIAYNNTLYVVMGRVVGKSYDKVKPKNLNSVLKICKSLTKAISFYHLKGYLHLDIKAENVFKIQETDELVKLFDFDSVHKKEDIINENCKPTYSKSCAAPEVKKIEHGKYDEIDERSDIYSIGAMLFRKVMHRDVDTEDSRPKKRWDFTNIELLKTESPQAKSALTEIFRNTLARNKKDRYKSTDELIEALDKAIEITSNKVFLCDHNITTTTSKDYYISRADKVREIREKLENYHIAYLYGIGGIGKSETAREYAETYRKYYNTIQITQYSVNLQETIAKLEIGNLEDENPQIEDRYNTRIGILSKKYLYNSNTLLIIDNYNVAPGTKEYKNNVQDVMKVLNKLDIHIIFTTRANQEDNSKTVFVNELSDDELIHMFFQINKYEHNNPDRISLVNKLLEITEKHTMTIDLVAHLLKIESEDNGVSLNKFMNILSSSGLKNDLALPVKNNKDEESNKDTVYNYIKALFNVSILNANEKYYMVNAAQLPVSGMKKSEFKKLVGADCNDNTINDLISNGWIKSNGNNIFLHPIISEVSNNELAPQLSDNSILLYTKNLVSVLTNSENKSGYSDCAISLANSLCKINNANALQYIAEISENMVGIIHYKIILDYCKCILNYVEKHLAERLEEHSSKKAELFKKVGNIYEKMGVNPFLMMSCYKKAICIKMLNAFSAINNSLDYSDDDNIIIANELEALGNKYTEIFAFDDDAIWYYEKSFEIKKKYYEQKNQKLNLAKAYYELGKAYFQINNHLKCQELFWNACSILKEHLNALYDDQSKIETLERLAKVYIYLDMKEAIKYLEQALKIRENKYCLSEELADAYEYLGVMYERLNHRIDKTSFDYFCKAMEVKKILYHNSPELLADLYESFSEIVYNHHSLAGSLGALPYLISALNIRLSLCEKGSIEQAKIYEHFAYQLNERCIEESESYFHIAYNIKLNLYKDNPIKLSKTHEIYGDFLLKRIEYIDDFSHSTYINHCCQKACEYYRNALISLQDILPEEHETIARIYQSISYAEMLKNNKPESIKNAEKSLSIRIKIYKDIPLKEANAYDEYGEHCLLLEYIPNALTAFKEALNIRKNELYPNKYNYCIANSYESLGNVYLKLGKKTIAIKCYEATYKIRKSIFKFDSQKLLSAHEFMSRKYLNILGYKKYISFQNSIKEDYKTLI